MKLNLSLLDAIDLMLYHLYKEDPESSDELLFQIIYSEKAKNICNKYGIPYEEIDNVCEAIKNGGKIVCLNE